MRRLLVVFVITLFAITSYAAKCQLCQTTMPLCKVEGRMYCKKHYCIKHKIVNHSGSCEQCELEGKIARGKGECRICGAKKELLILSVSYNRWDVYCKTHYCAKHQRIFSKQADEHYCCRDCQLEERAKKKQEELEQKEKEWQEAQEQSRREAQAARDARQKAEAKLQAEHNLFMSKELDSLFGVRLGGRRPLKEFGHSDSGMQVFTPAKKFRDFDVYHFGIQDDKVAEVQAVVERDDLEAMKNEFYSVISVLDRKYGVERRGDIIDEALDKFRCKYDFGCNPETGKDAKQRLVVYTRYNPKTLKYRIVICAYLVDAANAAYEKEQQQDMDAL